METKFRSIPLSIIDFFGVIVPGFVWLVLMVAAMQIATKARAHVTPMTAWDEIRSTVAGSGTWLGPLAVILLAILIGYSLKPRAMRFAGWLGAPALKLRPRFRSLKLKELKYPYRAVHIGTDYYAAVETFAGDVTKCDIQGLPGNQPFTTVKRMLRLNAPALWEECEHMEAEVRLVGTLFLAAVFSFGLAIIQSAREIYTSNLSLENIAWLVASAVIATVLADGFNHFRVREVEYTYLFTIVAFNAKSLGLLPAGSSKSGNSE